MACIPIGKQSEVNATVVLTHHSMAALGIDLSVNSLILVKKNPLHLISSVKALI